jgi:hypothetical protein
MFSATSLTVVSELIIYLLPIWFSADYSETLTSATGMPLKNRGISLMLIHELRIFERPVRRTSQCGSGSTSLTIDFSHTQSYCAAAH